MEQLNKFACVGAIVVFSALASVIFAKFILGIIPLDGLLTGDRRDGSSYFSFGRSQLLVCTVIVAVKYLGQIAVNPLQTSLPDMPAGMLELLGCSQLVYLIGKGRAFRFGASTSPPAKGDTK